MKLVDLRRIWPDMPEKSDVSDLIAMRGESAKAEIGKLVRDTEDWKPVDESGFLPYQPFDMPAQDALPDFPIDALPPVLRNLCKEAAPSLLAACALCLQGAFQIEGKRGHTEALSLYYATVERPSGNKTQAFELAVGPVREWQKAKNQNRRQRINAWETDLKKLQVQLAAAEKSEAWDEVNEINAELDEHADREVKPIFLLQGDCTPESLFDAIMDNRGRAGFNDHGDGRMVYQ